MIGRRDFIAGLGAATALPLAALAQRPDRMRRIGVLMGWLESDLESRSWFAAFIQELARLGWVGGRNVQIDQRWTDDRDRARLFAIDLVELQPDVILAGGTLATAALQQETRTIPIVFAPVADPVGSGFVAGLPRPGGNLTGFISIEGPMSGRWLQMIKEIAPRIQRAAAMYNPDISPYAKYYLGPFKSIAKALSVDPIIAPVRSDIEIETAMNSLGREQGCLVILPDNFMLDHRAAVIAAATRNKVPAIYFSSTFARDGGLLSYGPSFPDLFRQAAGYVDRILKGDKPNDLPVQLPTKFDLVVNLKTAKAIDLIVPATLLVFANEVIE